MSEIRRIVTLFPIVNLKKSTGDDENVELHCFYFCVKIRINCT